MPDPTPYQPARIKAHPATEGGTSFAPFKRWHISFAMDCNLRCRYCITSHGTYGKKPAMMAPPIQSLLIGILAGLPYPLELEFGTGETFLYYNEFIEFISRIREQRAQHGQHDTISVSTNGTLLNETKIDNLLKLGVSLIFSLDGDKDVHQQQRTDASGRTHYATAFANHLYYRQKISELGRGQLKTVMSVITGTTTLKRLTEFWTAGGVPLFSAIIAIPKKFSEKDAASRYRAIQEGYLSDLRDIAISKAKSLSNPGFLSDFTGPVEILYGWKNLLLDTPPPSCGLLDHLLAVDAYGEIYPCELLMSWPSFRLGSLESGIDTALFQSVRQLIRPFESQCADCSSAEGCQAYCLAERYSLSPDASNTDNCTFARRAADILKESYRVLS